MIVHNKNIGRFPPQGTVSPEIPNQLFVISLQEFGIADWTAQHADAFAKHRQTSKSLRVLQKFSRNVLAPLSARVTGVLQQIRPGVSREVEIGDGLHLLSPRGVHPGGSAGRRDALHRSGRPALQCTKSLCSGSRGNAQNLRAKFFSAHPDVLISCEVSRDFATCDRLLLSLTQICQK